MATCAWCRTAANLRLSFGIGQVPRWHENHRSGGTDSERVTELLCRDSGGRAYATAFHMHLVDSCASKFRTEVFQVKYTTASGEKCHIIGLRRDGAQVKFACV